MSADKLTESDVTAMIRRKYSGQEWSFLSQVPNATGTSKSRVCDGLAMSLWPSKGLHLHGFEIKVARSDWLKEIQDTSKSHAFQRYCSHWWIVAPKRIVKLEELPATWGLQCPTPSGNLRVMRPASKTEPEALTPNIVAGIFRAATRAGGAAELQAARSAGYDEGRTNERRSQERTKSYDLERTKQQLEALQRGVDEFEAASGIRIHGYDGKRLGDVVSLINRLGATELAKRFRRISDEALAVRETAAAVAKEAEGFDE